MQIREINPYGAYREARMQNEDRAAQSAQQRLAQMYASRDDQRAAAADTRAQGAYDANQKAGQTDARVSSIQRLSKVAQQALTYQDPMQRKGFLQQAIPAYQQDFAAIGADISQLPQMLQMPDAELQSQLEQVAGLGIQDSQDQEGFGQPQTVVGPDGKPSLVQFGNRGTSRPVNGYQPSPLEQYGRVNPGDYTPESLAKYSQTRNFSDLVRIWAPTVENVGNVPTAIARQVGAPGGAGMQPEQRPLSTLEKEAAGRATVAGAEAGAKTTATATAERLAAIQKKGMDATTTLDMLNIAEPLIDVATGSAVGAGVDALAGFFGGAPDGAQAISSLKILQAGLMLNMPRMEGPQSDRDAMLYREAAGRIGDSTVPRATKLAALNTIRTLQQKYQQRAGVPTGGSQPANGPVRVSTPQEAAKLPKGTRFVTPDGQERVRR